MKDKVVLAFSGGLDTSYCVKYLTHERGLDVHSVIVNTGGFSVAELQEIEKKAYTLGVKEHTTVDAVEKFYQKAVKYLIFGNVLRYQTYPLSVSAERMFQALEIVEYAQKSEAKYIAHGSTGAGNDQVRFDLVFHILAPEIEVITPIREQQLSRPEEIEYLQEHGVEMSWEKAKYSINKGLWGTSVGGAETLTSDQPLPDAAYPSPLKEIDPKVVTIGFEKGEPMSFNDQAQPSVSVIGALEAVARRYAVGRDIHVGDTVIGIKGRVGFEAAAALLTIKAHHALEKHTLTKWQLYWKEQMGNWYGMMLHEGQYLDPVMRDIEGFLESTQELVTGEVDIQLTPYHFQVNGIRSDFDLMQSDFGHYGEMNKGWTGEDVKGFTKILANQVKIYHAVKQKNNG